MRLLPKRLSLHIQTESKKLKKSIIKRYHEVSSDSEREHDSEETNTSDDCDEVITPRESPSSTRLDLPLEFNDNSGNFVRTMRIIKRESKRLSTLMIINDENAGDIVPYLDDLSKSSNNDRVSSHVSSHVSSPTQLPPPDSLDYSTEDFYSEYFLEKSAKDRAIYIACRIKKQLPLIFSGIQLALSKETSEPAPEVSPLDITKMIADRLYTLTHIREMMQPLTERTRILDELEENLLKQGDSDLSQKTGGREAFFAFRYTLDHYFKHNILPSQKSLMVERAREVIQQCFESEEKLNDSERECMYCFHRLMSGMKWDEDGMEPILCGLSD